MDDDDPGLRLVHLLRRVSVEFELFRTEFGNLHQLHPTDLRALIQLLDARRAQTAATPGWLGEQLGLNSAGTTALIDRLETAGHVRRERDTLDRRRVLLVVEDRAIELGWTFFGPLFTDMIAAMREFDETQLAAAQAFLTRMSDVIATSRCAAAGWHQPGAAARPAFGSAGSKPTVVGGP